VVIIRNFDEEIKKAKEEIIAANIAENRRHWQVEFLKANPGRKVAPRAPEPSLEEVTPKAWFETQWGSGFVVADLEKLMKIPVGRRNKIFALGGI